MLYWHAAHGEAVARIAWCITEHALGVITGEVGVGKTVALRSAPASLDASRDEGDRGGRWAWSAADRPRESSKSGAGTSRL